MPEPSAYDIIDSAIIPCFFCFALRNRSILSILVRRCRVTGIYANGQLVICNSKLSKKNCYTDSQLMSCLI